MPPRRIMPKQKKKQIHVPEVKRQDVSQKLCLPVAATTPRDPASAPFLPSAGVRVHHLNHQAEKKLCGGRHSIRYPVFALTTNDFPTQNMKKKKEDKISLISLNVASSSPYWSPCYSFGKLNSVDPCVGLSDMNTGYRKQANRCRFLLLLTDNNQR